MTTTAPLLEVENLTVSFPGHSGTVHAVNGASFVVRRGERLGVVGESGSGKSVTALGIMGLIQTPGAEIRGRVMLRGIDLLTLSSRERRRLCGSQIGMVFQNPMSCLNPAMTIGAQIAEAVRAHNEVSRRAAKESALELLARVGIPRPARSFGEYPHRFSGGMKQRVMIASALACEPDLVIADEPTTALDVSIQNHIVDLLVSVCEERRAAVMLITHDLALLAGFAQRLVVMYAGRVVEEGFVDTIYYGATHPYTWGLMSSVTRVDQERSGRLSPISGNPPSATAVPPGCPFHPRCPYAEEECATEVPPLSGHGADDHPSACHFAGRLTPPPELETATG